MGTIRARFTLVSTSGAAFTTSGAGDNAIHSYLNHVSTSGAINYNVIGSNFFLDGSLIGIPYASLPPGILLTGFQSLTSPRTVGLFSGSPGYWTQTDGVGNDIDSTISFGTYSKIKDTFAQNWSLFVGDIPFTSVFDLLNILTLSVQTTYVSNTQTYVNSDVIDINGTYTTWSYTYTIDTPTVNTIGPSNKVRITSTYPAAGALDLSKIITNGIDSTTGTYNPLADTGIAGVGLIWINLAGVPQFYYIPIRYIDFEPDLLEFEIPPPFRKLIWKDPTIPGWPVVPVTPIIYGNGTQFSGWVNLTPLTVTLVDASGVYRLVKDKTNDTLYDQIAPISTYNVKIPNPFIKTGFIGG